MSLHTYISTFYMFLLCISPQLYIYISASKLKGSAPASLPLARPKRAAGPSSLAPVDSKMPPKVSNVDFALRVFVHVYVRQPLGGVLDTWEVLTSFLFLLNGWVGHGRHGKGVP